MVDQELVSKHGDVKKVESYGFGIRHVQVIVMSLAGMILFMMRSSMGVAILNMTDQSQANNTSVEIYTWSEEIRGVILSSFFWGYVMIQIPAGVIASKFGAKPLIMAALLLNGTFCLLTPFMAKMGGWIALCVIRAAMGLTQGCLFPSIQAFLGKWAPPQERSVLSVIPFQGVQAGIILVMPICGILASTSFGWPLIFYTTGATSFIVAIVFWAFTANTPSEHRLIKETEIEYILSSINSKVSKSSPIPWKKILTSMPVLAIAIAQAGTSWSFTLFFVQLPTYLKQGLGIDLSNSATLSALPFISQGVGQVVASVLSDFIYKRNIISTKNTRRMFNTTGSVCAGLVLIILSFLDRDHKILAISLSICSLGFLGTVQCGYSLNHLDLTPNYAGITCSLSNSFASLIAIITPISTGFILGDDPTNPVRWRIIFCLAAAIAIFSNVIYVIFLKTETQPWNDPEYNGEYNLGNLQKKSLTTDQEIKNYTFTQDISDKS